MKGRSPRGSRSVARRVFTAVAAPAMIAMLGIAARPAHAAQNANGSINVTPPVVQAGGTVHITGSVSTDACPQPDAVTITGVDKLFPQDGFGPQASRDSSGAYATHYTVPSTTPAGSYQLGMRCGGGNVGVTASLQVISDPVGAPATGAGGSARGSSPAWLVLGAGCLLLAGGAITLRRRLFGLVS